MEEHFGPITLWVNHHFGGIAAALLSALHIKPENPEMPIPQHVIMSVLMILLVTVVLLVLRSRLSVAKPGATQQVAEMLLTNPMRIGIRDVLDEAAGHHARSFIYFVGTISLFVLFSNVMSVFPWFAAPTSEKTVPLACASLTFLYFNYQGVKHLGPVHYLKNFSAGTPIWIAWLILPLEMISTCARVL